MSLQELGGKFVELFQAGNYADAAQLLPHIKLGLAKAGLMVPVPGAPQSDLLAARQVLELGVLAAIHVGDEEEINRLIAQIRPFYGKELGLPVSQHENKLVALHLLLLVSRNEIAEFHTELEMLPSQAEFDEFLSYPIKLERWLMEGSYDKVWKAITEQDQFPSPEFAIVAESLVFTVRSEIAACIEKAYDSLPPSNARHLLFLSSDQEIYDFVTDQPGWLLRDGRIVFEPVVEREVVGDDSALPVGEYSSNERLVANTLGYALQIETII